MTSKSIKTYGSILASMLSKVDSSYKYDAQDCNTLTEIINFIK